MENTEIKIPSNIQDLSEQTFQKNIYPIINKWLSLQRILKENQILEKIIEKQHSDNNKEMKNYILNFFKLKIKTRKIYEDIKTLRIDKESITYLKNNSKDFYVIEPNDTYFGNALEKMENLISIIRNNYEYIPKLVSLIDEDDKQHEIDSLAELFCNQFYTNIFIQNPYQEELLICLYKILEQEINKIDVADLETFLDDSTFMGKFLTSFSKQPEINNFSSNILDKVFGEVEKRNNYLLDLSLNKMMKYIKKEKENKKELTPLKLTSVYTISDERGKKEEQKGINPIERILEKIPKTKINFKKQFNLEDEVIHDNQPLTKELSPLYNEDIEFELESNIKNDCNTNYFEDLTEEILSEKLKELSDPDLIAFYEDLINKLKSLFHNPYAFANSNFFLTLKQDYYFEEKNILAKIYLKNFLFIQEQVEDIIQSLIDKIATIPFTLRCICTMIDKLIQKKFPKFPKYFRHSFIGKFLFNKCIFPMLILENTNGSKNTIFTKSQIGCLKCIVSVLDNANKCKLFDNYKDVEKTMFNYYLLEIIPILNKFYDKLVDMQLPNKLNKLINDSKKIGNYDYFKENPDEILRIKTVCFNEKDILFIIRLLNKNIELFKDLPEFNRIKSALKEREMNERELEKIIFEQKKLRFQKKIDTDNKGEGFYIFIYNEQNPKLDYKLKEFFKEDKKKKKDKKSLLFRIKNSIKAILRRLNLLNFNEYSYLNYANSNENFFQALNCTLKDFDDEENKIPLSWHSKFIINNKNKLDQGYINNDFEKLYEEIFNEENNYLKKLKSLCLLINIKEEINLSYAENAIENMKFFTKNIEKAKKLEKVKIFIAKDRTEVCIKLKDPKKLPNSKTDQFENNKIKYIKVKSADKCSHLADKFLARTQGNKINNINSHAKSVNEFIYKLIKPKGIVHQTILKYIKEDINIGNASHQIYSLFSQYKELLKQSLFKNFKELIEDENDADEIMENIEDYILKKIYKYIFPIKPLDEDLNFEKLTKSYNWLQTTDLSIKENIQMEDIQDSISYLKQMEEKAKSISEKIKCLEMIYKNMNRINEFYFDKLDMSVEAQSPIFYYIIVKSHPKRFITNINYLNCFTRGKNMRENQVLINNCITAIDFIYNYINPSNLHLTKEEFNKRCDNEKNKFLKL